MKSNEIKWGFGGKLTAFITLTFLVRKRFMDFLIFAFICNFLQPNDLVSPIKDSFGFQEA